MKLPNCSALVAALSLLSSGLAACGPSHVQLDPREVVNVNVRPASQQLLFCPGDPFQVEVVAKLKDGSSCSSTDASRGCMDERDAVIDPGFVRVEGSSGARTGAADKFIWMPDPDPLKTADTGLLLRGWLERVIDGQATKSVVGESELRPVYECQKDQLFTTPPSGAHTGEAGRPGPDLDIAVTTLSTPYYPNAALIRIDSSGRRMYVISPSADQPVRVVSKGQNGAFGRPGQDGRRGEDGADAAKDAQCAKGGNGTDGENGGPGGPGGDGGPGGTIRITLDESAADKLRGRVQAVSEGGEPGPGGRGGFGGFGGQGGDGGPTGPECTASTRGADGKKGEDGPNGSYGRRGMNGPAASIGAAGRQALFGGELGTIERIEAAKAKK